MRQVHERFAYLSLFALAVVIGSIAAYLLSILWRGDWKYSEMIAPIILAAVATLALLAIVAVIATRRGRTRNAAMLISGLVLVCGAVVACVFFGVLDNCRLSCGPVFDAVVKSPTGQWTAIRFSTKCTAIARYCPAMANVSIVNESERLVGTEGIVFRTSPDTYTELSWKSDDVLLIRYGPGPRILRHEHAIGRVKIEYLPTGSM
jgi:hypothetical protein